MIGSLRSGGEIQAETLSTVPKGRNLGKPYRREILTRRVMAEVELPYTRGDALFISASVLSQSRLASHSPPFARTIILLATIATIGSVRSLRWSAAHVISNATPMMRFVSGSN